MALAAPKRKVTLRSDGSGPFGLHLDKATNTVTRIVKGGLVDRTNSFGRDTIEVGDRIMDVNEKTGNAQDMLVAWKERQQNGAAWAGGSPSAPLRLTVLRPFILQPLTIQVPPGKDLGLNVAEGTGVVEEIKGGVVASLNSEFPGTVEVGDRIIAVESSADPMDQINRHFTGAEGRGDALEEVRAWFAWKGKDRPGALRLTLAKVPKSTDGASPDSFEAAWTFSVALRAQQGASLGLELGVGTNAVHAVHAGLVADLNAKQAGAVQVGDRLLEVDGAACPKVSSAAELEALFETRTRSGKDIRLRVLRPVKGAAAEQVTVLPTVEYGVSADNQRAAPPAAALPAAEPPATLSKAEQDLQSASTASTPDAGNVLAPDASGKALPYVKQLSKEVPVTPVAPVLPSAAPNQRRGWFGMFCETECCDTVNESEDRVVVHATEGEVARQ